MGSHRRSAFCDENDRGDEEREAGPRPDRASQSETIKGSEGRPQCVQGAGSVTRHCHAGCERLSPHWCRLPDSKSAESCSLSPSPSRSATTMRRGAASGPVGPNRTECANTASASRPSLLRRATHVGCQPRVDGRQDGCDFVFPATREHDRGSPSQRTSRIVTDTARASSASPKVSTPPTHSSSSKGTARMDLTTIFERNRRTSALFSASRQTSRTVAEVITETVASSKSPWLNYIICTGARYRRHTNPSGRLHSTSSFLKFR
jgi:hypothetical protein